MTVWILVLLAAFAGGVYVGQRYAPSSRTLDERLRRRSRVLYELAEGDKENVAFELEQIAESEPEDTTCFLALAALDRARGRTERAKAIHRTVLASANLPQEQRVAALVGLGRDLLAQGNERAAVGALVRAISLAPRSVATLESLARALEAAGAWERAAAAWERHEKLVEGRRRRESRVGRGHALAGQALVAMVEGDDRKARKLAERATELAPDSGHVWTARARVEATVGNPKLALDAWQRAWELAPAGAHELVPEAWAWASEQGLLAEMVERMLATLRSATDPELVVALAERVARRHPDQAADALERVGTRSALARLSLVRLHLGRGHREEARKTAMAKVASPAISCRLCGRRMERFRYRCDHCGAWDSAVTEGIAVRTDDDAPPALSRTL